MERPRVVNGWYWELCMMGLGKPLVRMAWEGAALIVGTSTTRQKGQFVETCKQQGTVHGGQCAQTYGHTKSKRPSCPVFGAVPALEVHQMSNIDFHNCPGTWHRLKV